MVAVLLGLSALGAHYQGWSRGIVSRKELRYGVSIAVEWLLLAFVLWGARKRGVFLRDLIGGRWDGIRPILSDMGVAVVFLMAWYLVLVCLAIITRPGHSPGVQRLLPHSRSELIVFMAVSATAGIVEEIIFRGYLQRQFEALPMSGWNAVTLQAVIFGLSHGYQGSGHMFIIGIFGFLFGVLARKRASLRPGMLAHAANDALGGIIAVFLKHSH